MDVEVAQCAAGPRAQKYAHDSTHEREGHALGNHLADEAGPASPQRGANGHLTLAHCGAHQNQVRDIHAGQQKNHSGKG